MKVPIMHASDIQWVLLKYKSDVPSAGLFKFGPYSYLTRTQAVSGMGIVKMTPLLQPILIKNPSARILKEPWVDWALQKHESLCVTNLRSPNSITQSSCIYMHGFTLHSASIDTYP